MASLPCTATPGLYTLLDQTPRPQKVEAVGRLQGVFCRLLYRVDGKANGRGSIAVELGDRSIKGQRHILAGLDDGPCSTSINKDGRPAFRADGSCKEYASGPISWSFDGKREILDASGAVTDSYQGRLTKAWKGAEEFNGEITNASGTVFKGTVNGITSKGTWTFKNGNSIRCTFVRAIANGSGCEQKNAKGSYVGDLKDGKRNGFGRITYETGGGYEGNFQDNQFSGNGALTFASGAKVIGNFAAGKPDGVVVHVDKDGQRTSQTFVAGQRVK